MGLGDGHCCNKWVLAAHQVVVKTKWINLCKVLQISTWHHVKDSIADANDGASDGVKLKDAIGICHISH